MAWLPSDWPHHDRSCFVRVGDIEWHVQRIGAGRPLVLVHGTGASTHSFRALMPLLARHYEVLTFDLPGHGFTHAPGFTPTLEGLAHALGQLLLALELNEAAAFVGHSAGAAVLLQHALDAPSRVPIVGLAAAVTPLQGLFGQAMQGSARVLAKLKLVSALLSLAADDFGRVQRTLEGTGSRLDAEGVELYRRLVARPAHLDGVLAMVSRWRLEGLYARLGQVTAPVRLIAGENDLAVPLSDLRRVAARLPHGSLEVLSGVGHLLHEEAPASVAARVSSAVEALSHSSREPQVSPHQESEARTWLTASSRR